jgi:3-oxoacyl-[acyl-carrier-protein] synthase II
LTERVAITGYSGITSLGDDFDSIVAAMGRRESGIRQMTDWSGCENLHTGLGGPVFGFALPTEFPRKKTRSMGRVAQFSTVTADRALRQAGLIGDPILSGGDTGIAYGSSSGSPDAMADFGAMLVQNTTRHINSTSYIRMMNHTAAVNTGLFFNLRGRLICTSTACTSGSQAIGYAYETVASGKQVVMVAGGAEELSITQAAVFDTLFATSTRNEEPERTPRPFDADRDGLVVGEGAATLVLENLNHALARGASILGEVVGFGTNCDARHVTQPTAETMAVAIRLALEDAGIPASEIGYVSAHGTATELGDIAESHATNSVFGSRMPISSMKGYFGHTLGACGSQEVWLAVEMMNHDRFWPTHNLEQLDTRCADLDYIVDGPREIRTDYVMSNNFAFGGINTSLIIRRWQ